jgi:hypothetical protein
MAARKKGHQLAGSAEIMELSLVFVAHRAFVNYRFR